MSIRLLETDEIIAASETLALAFDADPFFRYTMPDAKRRRAWLTWFHRRALGECHRVGGAFTFADEGGAGVGAMGLYPPGTWPLGLGDRLRATPLPPGLPPHRLITVGLSVEQRMHESHPIEPHVYVYVVGVHPSQKGKGLGGALLRQASLLAQDAEVVAHLETSNPENIPLYGRFGYEVKTEIASDGPPVWTMTTERQHRVRPSA